jgi:RNA polymerase sigma-70 factor, ECF subfamily
MEPALSAEHYALQGFQATAVRAAIAKLKPANRQVVELRFLQEKSLPEVADICGIKEGAVKARQHRAIQDLKRILSHTGPL